MNIKGALSKLIPIYLAICLHLVGYSQVPQGFSYQAVIRNSNGTPIAGQSVKLHILLTNQLGTITHYEEQHTLTTTAQGLANIIIGEGNSKVGTLMGVPWQKGDICIKVEVDPTGTSGYQPMGNPIKLQSVPFALFAENAKEVVSPDNASDTDPIFVVKNKLGQIVFAVYQTGVRAYVSDTSLIKGAKGGFAIGGLTSKSISETQDYLNITPSGTRIWFNNLGKGAKGGFAIGGLTGQGKEILPTEYFTINSDSARIRLKDPAKGAKGGFAIGGLTSKSANNYLQLTPENYFIGHESGKANTEGEFNSFLGYQAGISNSIGSSNSLMGYQAGYSNTEGSGNLLLGYQSGYSNTIGDYNTFLGYLAGNKNTSGVENTFVGSFTGMNNTNGSNNTFLGFNTGYSNTTGESNNFIGFNSGYSNSSGKHNVFIGTESGFSNTTGSYNSFMGYHAGRSNTKGEFNVLLGYEAGLVNDSSYNAFIGYQAGRSNTKGINNIFIGYQSGLANTQASGNTYLGVRAGQNNNHPIGGNVMMGMNAGYNSNTYWDVYIGNNAGYDTYGATGGNIFIGAFAGEHVQVAGGFNVFIGQATGRYATTPSHSQYIGYGAGMNSSGGYNSFMGHNAGQYSTANVNVAIGRHAGRRCGEGNIYLGDYAGENCTNSINIGIGVQAGRNSSGSNNLFLGYMAGYNEAGNSKLYITNGTTTSTKADALIYGEFETKILAFNAKVGIGTTTPDEKFVIFNGTSTGKYTTSGWTHSSDLRLKENITNVNDALSGVLKLQGVKFNFISDPEKSKQIGFIAQDFEKIFPELVVTDKDGYKSIAYGQINAVLVEAIKEQQQQINDLKAELEAIKALLKK